MLGDTDASVVSVAAALGYPSQTAFAAVDRRNPKQLATAHALTAIALQARQSLWGSCTPEPLDHCCIDANNRRRQEMVWRSAQERRSLTINEPWSSPR